MIVAVMLLILLLLFSMILVLPLCSVSSIIDNNNDMYTNLSIHRFTIICIIREIGVLSNNRTLVPVEQLNYYCDCCCPASISCRFLAALTRERHHRMCKPWLDINSNIKNNNTIFRKYAVVLGLHKNQLFLCATSVP